MTAIEEHEKPNPKVIHADPTKDFFVNMITRDIALLDCIFDLLDNAIDGARRTIDNAAVKPFEKCFIEISLGRDNFSIGDNCGGITLDDAINHAFHFGRRPRSSGDVKGGIGLYGIGMKRAIFKIGKLADVISHASDASFKVSVDVDKWIADEGWDFTWDDVERSGRRGTSIMIAKLNKGIGDSFVDSTFKNELIKSISRDYAFFINQGLVIKVDGVPVPSYEYGLKQNASIEPGVQVYSDDGVSIRIIAGLLEDLADDIPDEVRPDKVERFGWYVVCNDRVVLAGDKTDKTIWGNDGFAGWHPQYHGFGGFVFFQSDDQNKLPWTTTKRDLDDSSPLYRRTVIRMKEMTSVFTSYSNRRKAELEKAKELESGGSRVSVYVLAPQATETPTKQLKLPSLSGTDSGPQMVTISYKRKKSEVDEIKQYAGNLLMPAKDVGHLTFEYYREVELGK